MLPLLIFLALVGVAAAAKSGDSRRRMSDIKLDGIVRPTWWPMKPGDRPLQSGDKVYALGNVMGLGEMTGSKEPVYRLDTDDMPALPSDALNVADKYSLGMFPKVTQVVSLRREPTSREPGLNPVFTGTGLLVDEWGRPYTGRPPPFWDSPIWDVAIGATYFIPGVGPAVSGGLATLQAMGQGASVGNAVLTGARAALPPQSRAAFDMGVGVVLEGDAPDAEQIARAAVASQLGNESVESFDQGMTLAKSQSLL